MTTNEQATTSWDDPEDEFVPALRPSIPSWDTDAPWDVMATSRHGSQMDSTRDRVGDDPSGALRAGMNDVLIIGALGVIGRNDGRVVSSGRNAFGAEISRLQVVVDDGIDAPYELPIELVHGMYLEHLDGLDLQRGTKVMLRGRLGRRGRFDRRYIDWRDPAHVGRYYEELTVLVDAIRLAGPDEVGGSLVRLRGRVVDPPAFPRGQPGRYRHVAGAVEVTELRPSRMPGSRAQESVETLIPIEMSLNTPNAEALLRRHNIVAIEGRLERYRATMGTQHSAIQPLLEQLQADVDDLQAQPHDGTRRDAERRLFNRKLNILHPYRTRVRVGYVELLEGKPCAPDEAAQLRAAFVNARRAARARRQHEGAQIISAAPDVPAARTPRESTARPPAESLPAGLDIAPGTDDAVVPRRHRKRRVATTDDGDAALLPAPADGPDSVTDRADIEESAALGVASSDTEHGAEEVADPASCDDTLT